MCIRDRISVYDLVHAMHAWRRQILLHKTFYYAVAPTPVVVGRQQSGPTKCDPSLTTEDLCAKLILSRRMCVGVVNTADMR
eukprot:5692286-Pyramimonas_sp.AAC.1